MPRVAFASVYDYHPWMWQTPGADGRWGDFAFRVTREAVGDDWLVVFDDAHGPIETDLPRGRRVLMVTEPPGIKTYRPGFVDQFGILLSPVSLPGFNGRHVRTDVGLPWHIGVDGTRGVGDIRLRWTFEELEALPRGEKRHALSAVISTKAILPRHRRRIEFVKALKERMGDDFHLFGRGFTEISDKADAILPFSHHLVIENNVEESFFTEKTTDAFLGWSLPVFSGCGDITNHFPTDALECFDLEDDGAVDRVVAAFATPVDERRLAAIAEARRRVLHEANIFPKLARQIGGLAGPDPVRRRTLVRPNDDFQSLRKRIKRAWFGWMSRPRSR